MIFVIDRRVSIVLYLSLLESFEEAQSVQGEKYESLSCYDVTDSGCHDCNSSRAFETGRRPYGDRSRSWIGVVWKSSHYRSGCQGLYEEIVSHVRPHQRNPIKGHRLVGFFCW